MDDQFNKVESLVKDFLAADTTLTETEGVKKFHTKVLPYTQKYRNSELPAVAVHTIGFSDDEQPRFTWLDVVVEVVARGGDFTALDAQVKRIGARVIKQLRTQAADKGGHGFKSVAASENDTVEDVRIREGDVNFFPDNKLFVCTFEIHMQIGVVQ